MRPWRYISPLLFVSGACALVYEVTWLREFRSLFGASTLASATVLGLFIGGVGIGSRLLGPRVDRHRDPFLLYLILEALIALTAAVTPAWLWLAKQAYLALGGSAVLGSAGSTAMRLLLAAPVLLPPTLLMGGTLPAAARAAEVDKSPGRHITALLYGTNTLGAVLGASLTTFLLLENLGNRRTIWLAAAVNLSLVGLGLLAWRLRGPLGAKSVSSAPASAPASAAESVVESHGATGRLVLLLAFASGFVFFLMELVFYRMLAPILGGSVFTLGLILTVALAGIGLGSLAYAVRASRVPPRLSTLSATFAAQALGLLLPYVLGDRVALLAAHLQPGVDGTFTERVISWALLTGLVVLPVALVAGFQFPLMVALLGRGKAALGRQTGDAYAYNTLGAVLGSLVGGFGLMSFLGAPGTWRLVVVLLLTLSVLVAFFVVKSDAKGLPLRRIALGLVAVGVLLTAQGPTAAWRHSGIGVGRFSAQQLATENGATEFLHRHRRAKLWEEDGVESSVALMGYQGLAFVVNGKVDGHVTMDAPTQIMAGLLGALLHGGPTSALVVGLGTGSTGGWLAQVPTMRRVDVAELEPAILRVAGDAAVVNRQALSNPKLEVQVGDGREILLTARQKYDLIVSEPSNPYRAGIASLFTQEFYGAVKSRLSKGGAFVQWVQVYEVDRQAIELVVATLATVFPNVETWRTHRDLLLVASQEPLPYSEEGLRERIAAEPYRTGLAAAWKVSELEGLFVRFVATPQFARAIAAKHGGPLNTDDRNLLEFGFARSVNRHHLFSMSEALRLAKEAGQDRPARKLDGIDWPVVEIGRNELYGVTQPKEQATERAFLELRALLLRGAVRAAASGRPLPAAALAKLRAEAPEAADVVEASLALRAHERPRALELLVEVFNKLARDPWLDGDMMAVALRLAQRLGMEDRAAAERLLPTLLQPMAVRSLEEQRAEVALLLAGSHQMNKACVEILSKFEPWVPWNRAFLERRVGCYDANRSPLLRRAQRDLASYVAAELTAPE